MEDFVVTCKTLYVKFCSLPCNETALDGFCREIWRWANKRGDKLDQIHIVGRRQVDNLLAVALASLLHHNGGEGDIRMVLLFRSECDSFSAKVLACLNELGDNFGFCDSASGVRISWSKDDCVRSINFSPGPATVTQIEESHVIVYPSEFYPKEFLHWVSSLKHINMLRINDRSPTTPTDNASQ